MFNLMIIGWLFLVTFIQCSTENDKLKVSLYYESLCPYCMVFINNQLYPGFNKIGDYLNLELVPYGNTIRKKVNGKWIFKCQHGPDECIFNKIHACGLAQDLDQKSSIAFVYCIESQIKAGNLDYRAVANKCSSIIEVGADKIIKCAEGQKGEELIIANGVKTDAVKPQIPGVPTVLYNDYYNETLEEYNNRFMEIACKLLEYKPDSCVPPNKGIDLNNKVSSEIVKVSVYYESLCPDSVRFITKQLQPTYALIGSNLEIDLVPYGKASHTEVDGKWEFKCQHGPAECRGNKLQACGLSVGQGDANKVSFVSCVMDQWNPSSDNAIEKCAPKLGIEGTESIFQCANSTVGDELLVKYGDQTHAVQPPISFIPTIIFNGTYDMVKQFEALTNLLKTVCKEFNVQPNGCANRIDSNWFY